MGLSMYLHRVPKVNSIKELRYLEKTINHAFLNNELLEELSAIKKENDYISDIECSIGSMYPINIYIRVVYWEKFNALHKWFVKNVQDDEDNCDEYIVTEDHLEKLDKLLQSLTVDNCSEIFPTQGGFFFGNDKYDESYWENVKILKHTVKYLIHHQPDDTTYIYSSSW